MVAARPAGCGGVAVAADDGDVVLRVGDAAGRARTPRRRRGAAQGPQGRRGRGDPARRATRCGTGTTTSGPDAPHLLAGRSAEPAAARPAPSAAADRAARPDAGRRAAAGRGETRRLAPTAARSSRRWSTCRRARRAARVTLVAIDTATGERRVLARRPAAEVYGAPRLLPRRRRLVVRARDRSTPTPAAGVHAGRSSTWPAASRGRSPPDWDRWPQRARVGRPTARRSSSSPTTTGRAPVFRVDLDRGRAPVRLTGDDGAYTDLQVVAGRRAASTRCGPPSTPRRRPVRLDPATPTQEPAAAAEPGRGRPPLPGTLHGGRGDGRGRHAAARPGWCCPTGPRPTRPAPLLLWIHGGPLISWNAWSWRWNPWILAARGYAVLLPDPALSTGYGQRVRPARLGRVGRRAVHRPDGRSTDAAVARPDIDEDADRRDGRLVRRLHGQLGRRPHRPVPRDRHPRQPVGARPVRGHDGRAVLLAAARWDPREHERYERTRPHRFVDADPHADAGDPRRQGLPGAHRGGPAALVRALPKRSGEDGTMPHKFLYFPDENHWVLKPQHAKVWYQVVEAFLDTTCTGRSGRCPDLLR